MNTHNQTLIGFALFSLITASCSATGFIGGSAKGSGAAKSGETAAAPNGGANEGLDGFTLGQKKVIKAQDSYFQRVVESTSEDCGQIDARIDWQTFVEEIDKDIAGEINYSFYGYCGEALATMAGMCRNDADVKAVIVDGVTGYVCRFGGPGSRDASLEAGVLTVTIDWEAHNNGVFVEGFLGKAL